MSYISLASKSDGDILTAAYLNQMANNAAYLQGLAGAVVIPFSAVQSATGSGISDIYVIRHTHRYLHYWISQTASTSDSIEIRYNGTAVYSDGGDRVAPYEWQSYIDLENLGVITPTPTKGSFYEITFAIVQKTGAGVTRINYILESPNTSL